jgi:hypothetical protein
MATEDNSKPSFSPGRKWSIGFNVVLLTFFVLAVVVMVNYLGQDYSRRFHVSTRTRLELSPHTIGLLKSITNHVAVTLYYDKDNMLYSTVADLLNEYRLANPRITVQTVNYLLDPGAAKEIKAKYKFSTPGDKDLVIFDCEGRWKAVPGEMLAKYTRERVPDEKEIHFLRKPVAFLGETAFDAALLSVTSPKRLKACFLTGHREHQIDSGDAWEGYLKFASQLVEDNIQVESLSLLGTNPVPSDCHLLVIAGPKTAIPDFELEKIEQYLREGGRLFALFDYASLNKQTGLEKILARWGVNVGNDTVRDPDNTTPSTRGSDIIVVDFSKKHPLVNPFVGSGSRLQLILPRSVGQLKSRAPAADAPNVEEIAFSGPRAQIYVDNLPVDKPQRVSLIAAVEKGAIKDVMNERGTTRMVIAGDSTFLGNTLIEQEDNRTFGENAVNWLLERTELVQGPAAKPISTYKILMTTAQLQSAEWILLGALPGAVLLLGCLVWLRRRR